jgi:hypothetical protein
MNRKEFEIILYNTKKLVGTAYCRKHNMECEVEIKNKSGGVVLTYHVGQQKHFYTNLASGKCKNCYYFNIKLELNGCEIEVLYPHGKREIIRLTPTCEDYSGRINYLKSIEIEVKREKFE